MLNTTPDYTLHKMGERQYLTFPALDKYEELSHLFTTRHGGVSSGCTSTWNFGAKEFDTDENILENFRLLGEIFSVDPSDIVRTNQTHTANILKVSDEDRGKGVTRERGYTDIDGLVTDTRGLVIVTTHADCNAVFFYDPVKHVIGLAHSGWRGTLQRISLSMVDLMRSEYGTDPGDIIVGIGPSLCQDCFEVDLDVSDAFLASSPDYSQFIRYRKVKAYIDLKGIIRKDLTDHGVSPENIHDMGLCTKCNTDDFFSHRGHHGKRGVMAAAMMLK